MPTQYRIVTLAPGHFHAALVHKRMHPAVDPRVMVFAPFDADLLAHLDRLRAFNTRPENPTAWRVDVRAGPDFLARFAADPWGDVAVIAGRNRAKIGLIRAAVSAGLHVLADKPWVVDPADFPQLEAVFREADQRGRVVWDMMTERFEVTSRIQRELMRDPAVFGDPDDRGGPVLNLETVHYLKKTVAGRPLVRPEWWFDPTQAGESVADVGTHLADLATWLLFPDTAVDHRTDITIRSARRWPTLLTADQFATLTGLSVIPPGLIARHPDRDPLRYHGNGTVEYTLRGLPVRLTTRWEYEAEPGDGDTHEAVARGTRATVSVRNVGTRPEVFVRPVDPGNGAAGVLRELVAGWQDRFPGTAVEDTDGLELRVAIPGELRAGHEAHFAEVFEEFLGYVGDPARVPAWERPNLLAKYAVTTAAAVS